MLWWALPALRRDQELACDAALLTSDSTLPLWRRRFGSLGLCAAAQGWPGGGQPFVFRCD